MWKLLIVFSILFTASQLSFGQSKSSDLKQGLVSPYDVLKLEDEIGLSKSQRDSLRSSIRASESKFNSWNKQLEVAMKKMVELLSNETVSEKAVMRQMDEILDIEKKIKKEQLRLLVKTKNTLRITQIEKIKVEIKVKN